jgi:hypothetical protein
MISSLSRTIVVFIFLIAKLCVFAEAAEEASLEIPLSGILGGDIDGEASSDNFGSAVAMSKNGSRVVVGARYHNSAEQVTDYYGNTYFQNSVGSVRVFEYGTTANSDVWSQLGGDVDGALNDCSSYCSEGEQFGAAVAMSSDGNRIVVGAPYRYGAEQVTDCYGNTNFQNSVGSVRVFEYGTAADFTGFSQLGGDIDGEAQSEQFGSAVAMSADGNRIVVGAPGHSNGTYSMCGYNNVVWSIGSVRVFEYGTAANPTGWSQVGADIVGEAQYERFGSVVAISADGNRIVVGNSATNYDTSTSVRVYEYGTSASPTDWTQLGSALQSSEANNNYMYGNLEKNVAASSDCARVVVVFPKSNYYDKVVRVYEYGTTVTPADWSQVGTDMTGEANEQFGSAVTMSADGNRVVIGARGGDITGDAGNYFGTFNDVGFVRVMQYDTAANPSDWSHIGANVFGEAQNDQFGSSVALSGDGNRVAVGAPYNDPSVQDAGHVRVLVTACVENAYVSDGACVACTPGSTNEAGDVLTQVDTVCDVAYCAAYEHVSNHTCVLCPVGSSNAPGDDPSGDDTFCDYFQKSTTISTNSCAAYEHVSNRTCVPCPLGTLNAPGDDPTGDDTDCDPLICGENYRVFSHECLKCETDVFNRAGDDASDDDTKCDGSEAYSPGSSTRLFRADYDDSSARSFDVGAVVWFTAGTMCVMSLFP